MAFGQAIGRSLDVDAIREIVLQHLPKLAGTDEAMRALIARADAALYRAKDQGRNCVRLSLETAA